MIKHITKRTHQNGNVTYDVYYDSGRKVHYDHNSNLPLTVVIVLTAGTCYETVYTEYGKVERFKR